MCPIRRIVEIFCEKIYHRAFPGDEVADLLQLQEEGEFFKWIHTTGLVYKIPEKNLEGG